MDDVTYIETHVYHPKFRNFINLYKILKNTIKLWWGFFPVTLTKKCKENQWWNVLFIRRGVTFKKLCNFITSWKRAKTPKTFVQGPFSIKLTKIHHKAEVKFCPEVPFPKTFCSKHHELLWLENTFHAKEYFVTVSLK